MNLGGILKLIEKNLDRNMALVKSKVCVTELDFLNENWSARLREKVDKVDVILAADGELKKATPHTYIF